MDRVCVAMGLPLGAWMPKSCGRGSSYCPASWLALSGMRWSRTFSSCRIQSLSICIFSVALRLILGNLDGLPVAADLHCPTTGQMVQSGLCFVQTVAPSSIIA